MAADKAEHSENQTIKSPREYPLQSLSSNVSLNTKSEETQAVSSKEESTAESVYERMLKDSWRLGQIKPDAEGCKEFVKAFASKYPHDMVIDHSPYAQRLSKELSTDYYPDRYEKMPGNAIRLELLERSRDAGQRALFLKNIIPSAVLSLSGRKLLRPVQLVDFLLDITEPIPVYRAVDLAKWIAACRGHIASVSTKLRDTDYYGTVGNLAIRVGRQDDHRCRRAAIYYYHEILSAYALRGADSYTAGDYHLLESTANNLAVRVSDENESEQRDDLLRKLKYLSIGAVLRSRTDKSTATQAGSEAISTPTNGSDEGCGPALTILQNTGVRFSETSGQFDQWPIILGGMMTIREPWSKLFKQSHELYAFVYATAAVARACTTDTIHLAPSACFNAGVEMLRSNRRSAYVAARAFINCLGLVWSLDASPGNLLTALREHDGLDCLTNLLGALVESGDQPRLKDSLQLLVCGAAPALKEASYDDSRRIENSSRKLKLDFDLPKDCSTDEMKTAALNVLRKMSEDIPNIPPPGEIGLANWAASALPNVFFSVIGPQGTKELADSLASILAEVSDKVNEPLSGLLEFYKPLAGSENAETGKGPLVDIGAINQPNWKEIAKAAVNNSANSPSAFATALRQAAQWASEK